MRIFPSRKADDKQCGKLYAKNSEWLFPESPIDLLIALSKTYFDRKDFQ